MDRPDPRGSATDDDLDEWTGAFFFVLVALALVVGCFLMFWPEVWSILRYLATGRYDAHSSELIRHAATGRSGEAATELVLLLIGLVEWIGLAYWIAGRFS